MKADLHIHTQHSHDSNMTAEEIIKAAKARGLDAIAVVDHNTLKGAIEVRKKARGTGLLVIPGEEIDTESGEIIALGIKREIEQGMSLDQACMQVKAQGGFIIVPHPYDRFRSGIGDELRRVLKHVDAIESFNARTFLNRHNRKAESVAKDVIIPCVAASDAHFPDEIGNAYVILDCNSTGKGITAKDVFNAIRKNNAVLVTNEAGLRRYPKTLWLKLRKRIRG